VELAPPEVGAKPTRRTGLSKNRRVIIAAVISAAIVVLAGVAVVFVPAANNRICACPAAIFFHASYESNTSLGLFHWYNLTVHSRLDF
jgi:hypothetical protein